MYYEYTNYPLHYDSPCLRSVAVAEVCFGRFIVDNARLNKISLFTFLLADKNRFKGMPGSRNENLKSYYHYIVTEPSR